MDTFEKIIEHLDNIQDRTKLMSAINDIIYLHVSESAQEDILKTLKADRSVLVPDDIPRWPESVRIKGETDGR